MRRRLRFLFFRLFGQRILIDNNQFYLDAYCYKKNMYVVELTTGRKL